MTNVLTTLLTDPTWFPHRYDARAATMRFLRLTRDTHRTATFLDDESLRAVTERVDVADADWATIEHTAVNPLHFVFHSAFCCSTLLARALDVPGHSMGLKEPAVLNDLTGARRAGVAAPRFAALLERTLTLLARPLSPGEVTIVKPGNVANELIDACLQLRPSSRAILMYSRLPVFLRSVAGKGLWGRRWARGLYRHLRPVSSMNPGYDEAEIFTQTDRLLSCGRKLRLRLRRALPSRSRATQWLPLCTT